MAITKKDLTDQPGVYDRKRMSNMTKSDLQAGSVSFNGIRTLKSEIIDRTALTVTSIGVSR